MAKKAVQETILCLRACGPSILREIFQKLPRLQAFPDERHAGDKDPHRTGRALDIILLSWKDNEKELADTIVDVFLAQRDDMKWSAVIYNQVEWDSQGNPGPRLWHPGIKEDRVSFEHLTHIHIEWTENKVALGGFWLGLQEALREQF